MLLFAFSLVIATSYIVARTIGDSLFLSRIGNEHLSLVFVLSGIFTAIVASAWYLLTKKYSVATTIQVSSFCFAAFTLTAFVLLPKYHHSFWLLAAIYLMADIKGCINAINIVLALNTKLGREASKSAWTVVGLAAPIAAVLAGGALALESAVLSIQTWLIVGMCLDVVAMAIGFGLKYQANIKAVLAVGSDQASSTTKPTAFKIPDYHSPLCSKAKTYVCSDKFRKWIGILIAAKVIVLTILAFEWKSAANTVFEGQTTSLVQFFGIYYGVVGFATIVLQLLLTDRFLSGKRLTVPVILMPAMLLFVSVSIFLSPSVVIVLVFATIGKSLDAWRRSVHDTTLNFLYTRIRRGQRRFAISLNSGLIKPLAEVAAASVIFLGTPVAYRSVLAAVLLLWVFAGYRLVRLVKSTDKITEAKQSTLFSNLVIRLNAIFRSKAKEDGRRIHADPIDGQTY